MEFKIEFFLRSHYKTKELIEIDIAKIIGEIYIDIFLELLKEIDSYKNNFDELELDKWYSAGVTVCYENETNKKYFIFENIKQLDI